VNVSPVRIYNTAPDTSPGLVALGFDPGIATPGITVVERRGQGFRHVWHKVLRSDSSMPDVDRYNELVDLLGWACGEFHPVVFASEEQRTVQSAKQTEEGKPNFNANNSKTIVTVGIAIGVARFYRVPFLEVRTQSARSQLIGKMKGTKDEKKKRVKLFVEKLLATPLPIDAAEAGLNAIYGLQLHSSERRRA
jgi:Holliday junction resolvasome RuvABC endonuclease subunit